MAETKTAKLLIDNSDYELPILSPTEGPDVLDIRKLYGEAGVFTYDPGFTSTASCDSTITFIDCTVFECTMPGGHAGASEA